MKKRILAALGTVAIFLVVLVWSRGDKPAEGPLAVKLPKAIGAIQPRLSPDGATVAFSYQGEIWSCPRGGGAMTLLTPSQGADTEPAWSPDGKRIAFVRGGGVKVVQFPDGKDVPLAKPAAVGGPYAFNKLEFSNDGKKLLGAFRIDGKDNSLAWFDLESGAHTSLLTLPAVSYTFRFALSPDGKAIVHTAMPDQAGQQSGNDGSHTDLLRLSADGKGQAEKLCRLPGRVHDLCWVDGGSLIVAAELGQAHDDLWKLPLDNAPRGMVKLSWGQADEDRPSVSRDGRWLVYTDNRAGATTLMARDLANGEEAAIPIDRMDYRRPTGTLKVQVADAADKKPLVARVSLQENQGRFHAPVGSLHRSLRGRGHFYCDGSTEMTLPAGNYRLMASR
jgi:Tol biopolymer transport system component